MWKLSDPAEDVSLVVEPDGVWLKGEAIDQWNATGAAFRKPSDRLGSLLATLVPQLLELDIASQLPSGVHIPFHSFVDLDVQGIDAFDDVSPWAPFSLEIESTGWIGGPTFTYRCRYYFGPQVVQPERLGCFVRWRGGIYRLDKQIYLLQEAIDSHNSRRSEEKVDSQSFVTFSKVKGLCESVGVQLDSYLQGERVLVPSRVGLDVVAEDEGRISFAPKIDGVPDESMRQVFFASEDVEQIYVMEGAEGGRLRVVLGESQRELLRRMQPVRHLRGLEKVEALRNPMAIFDGVAGAIDLDAESFGPRVKGIGDFPFAAQPFLRQSSAGIFDGYDEFLRDLAPLHAKFEAGIQFRYADGSVDERLFGSRPQLVKLQTQAQEAWRDGRGTLDYEGKSVVVDQSFVRALEELVVHTDPSARTKGTPSEVSEQKRRFLLVHTNEQELGYKESMGEQSGKHFRLDIPRALKRAADLKEHQKRGLAWLQANFRLERHGCLLADDMGLGKTLQVLMFLAWLIEKGYISEEGQDPDKAPWNPILVVAPIILLENETWVNDMQRFFRADGAIFQPWLTLHKSTLHKFRRPGVAGRETEIGSAFLDLEQLRLNRVIFTNYETITNYQHSFARMKDRWTVVVTDEAQEYKTPNTKISLALKSLAPRFRIACTGTPVETRLLDVWNLFDFLQPGNLLGSAAEFKKNFEGSPDQESQPETTLASLKERLLYGRPNAFLLRRDKTSLVGLPLKHDHPLLCDLSAEQRNWHLDLVSRAKSGTHPLGLIHHLMRLYQHPTLVPRFKPLGAEEATSTCPKLAAVMDCLRRIRRSGEKALIFTRTLDMQQLLSAVIRETFEVPADIINGATSRQSTSEGQRYSRKSIVARFRESPGFDVLILSPDVAGIGLTLTEANHVIHYGRWWNPAKESQATDRVYRIGQTKPVHVYYPIAKDPQRAFDTFDEKLDALIRRRRELAADFLTPMPSEGAIEEELLRDILEAPPSTTEPPLGPFLTIDDVAQLHRTRFQALVALIEESVGAHVILTPVSGSQGIDVIAAKLGEIRLIRCIQPEARAGIGEEAVADLIAAVQGYRRRRLARVEGRFTFSAIIVSNGTFTSHARAAARTRNVQLESRVDLGARLENGQFSLGQIEARELLRLSNMQEVQAEIDRIAERFV